MIFLPLICPDVARISATRHLVRILNVLHYMTTLYFWPCIKGGVVRKRNAKRELLLDSKYKNQGRHQKENIFSVDADKWISMARVNSMAYLVSRTVQVPQSPSPQDSLAPVSPPDLRYCTP